MSEHPVTTELFDDSSQLRITEAELRVVAGPDRGVKLVLPIDAFRIGSASSCDLVLHDPSVSAQHAEITSRPGRGFVIRDLGSKNGIVIGGAPIEQARLVDRMRFALGRSVLAVRALGRERTIPLARSGAAAGLEAHSVAMRALAAAIEQLAPSDASVLLEGETGVGKEIVAQAVHALSHRARGPFVVVDCGAIAPGMVAAELFGHERGAFTGADAPRAGLLEEADGGTLFLDEIGELPLDQQPVFLRALETRSSRRIGSAHTVTHDVRIVAATTRNLAEEVRARRFRQDLFFRLAGARLKVPPLRERREDIPYLADIFAREAGFALTPEMINMLVAFEWHGNVRELRNTVHRLAVQPLSAALATPEPRRGEKLLPLAEARRVASDEFERRYVERALAQGGGVVARAAEIAGVSRQFMSRLAAKHGITKP